MTPAEAAAAAYAGTTPSAAKRGRYADRPYVPMIVDGQGATGRHQLLGRAFATRDEAVACAARHIDNLRADLASKLAKPNQRALRAHYGVDA